MSCPNCLARDRLLVEMSLEKHKLKTHSEANDTRVLLLRAALAKALDSFETNGWGWIRPEELEAVKAVLEETK